MKPPSGVRTLREPVCLSHRRMPSALSWRNFAFIIATVLAGWHGYVETHFPAPRREQRQGASSAEEAAAQGDVGIPREASADDNRDRSLRCKPPLCAAAAIVRAFGEVDRAAARQAIHQARQERCGGRGSAVRGDEPADDALRASEYSRAASGLDAGRRT